MNTNFLKTWLLAVQTVFLTVVKKAIKIAKAEAIASAKTYTDDVAATTLQSAKSYTDTKLSQLDVLGEYKGSAATLSGLNALSGVGKGDLGILTTKDGNNKPGIYVYNDTTSTFEFVIEIKSADAQALVDGVLSKIGDLANLTTTEQTTLVGAINELVTRLNGVDTSISSINTAIEGFNTSISSINSKFDDYALKNGNADNYFLVKDAEVNTKQAVNASQFDFTFTEAEAQAAWDAINVDEPAYNFDVTADWASVNVIDQDSFLTKLADNDNISISDFNLSGNRLRANLSNANILFVLDGLSIDFNAVFIIPNETTVISLSNNTGITSNDLDFICTYLLSNCLALVEFSYSPVNASIQPTAVNQAAISALCTANGGSASFGI